MTNFVRNSLFLVIMASVATAAMPGGISDDEKPANAELNTMLLPILPALKTEISKVSNGPVDNLEAVSYKTQVVAGLNYFVKFRIGTTDEYFHARIFRDLKGNVTLVKVSPPKKEVDPIVYFH